METRVIEYCVPPLAQEDIETCRAFGIPPLLMRAVSHPELPGGSRYFIARLRDSEANFLFSGAALCADNLWITLLNAFDLVAGDNERCAVNVRVVDILAVTMSRSEEFWKPSQIQGALGQDVGT